MPPLRLPKLEYLRDIGLIYPDLVIKGWKNPSELEQVLSINKELLRFKYLDNISCGRIVESPRIKSSESRNNG